MTSPVVRMMTSSIASSFTPSAAASRARTVRACTSASGLPRVPMRKRVRWIASYYLAMLGHLCSSPSPERGGPEMKSQ